MFFFVAPLFVIAVALPFLFAVVQTPTPNVWPLLASWVCGGALVLLVAVQSARQPPGRLAWARALAGGLALAAVVGSAIGLVQYLVGDVGLGPWIHASSIGQAVGNLRQRNQQASLLSLGLWALL